MIPLKHFCDILNIEVISGSTPEFFCGTCAQFPLTFTESY